MGHYTISSNQYEEISERLFKLEQILSVKQLGIEDRFLDNQEFIQLMYISKRTAQAWRDQGLISYSQIGHKIYYRISDVNLLLSNFFVASNSVSGRL